MRHIKGLDTLRAVAVLLVIKTHWTLGERSACGSGLPAGFNNLKKNKRIKRFSAP